MKRDRAHISGCLVGGAVGDAFGAPVKFIKYDKIISMYGEKGITKLEDVAKAQKMEITDDTQMTLFTAEGLIRSFVRSKQKKIDRNSKDTTMVVFRSYIRWLYTQGLKMPNWPVDSYDGWLTRIKPLYFYRDPGITCITALGKGIMGKIEKPINGSKRCGAVIRVAPVGLIECEEHVFEVGCKTGAITHGHPMAYLSAGALSTIIFHIIEGKSIEEATKQAIEILALHPEGEQIARLLEEAIALSKQAPSVEHLQALGDGFMANEAVAMGVYAALSYPDDFESAILLAVNQDGNSNSVAGITGSILGAYLGMDGIDEALINRLELADVVMQMGEDILSQYEETSEWLEKYPGW